MMNGFCPKCSKMQDLDETVEKRIVKDENSTEVEILMKVYHCSKCSSFVFSERFQPESEDIEAE